MNEKKTGSYYTPQNLVEYMVKYSINNKHKKILEPSVGDGRFIDEILNYNSSVCIDAVDIVKKKVEKLKRKYSNNKNINIYCSDYIEYSNNTDKKYDVIIGNPPYINIKNLSDESINCSKQLLESMELPKTLFKNIWVSFILASISLLNENGTLFFVLPFEFLQVKYAEKLRNYLEKTFNVIEIISFKESVFPSVDQEICLVYMSKIKKKPYIKYTVFQSVDDKREEMTTRIKRNKPLAKWSNSILSDDEIDLLISYSKKFTPMREVGDISPGIVTGANSFFIVDKNFKDKNLSESLSLPIISRSRDIQRSIIFKKSDFYRLADQQKKVYLINIDETKSKILSSELKDYIKNGEVQGINKRYKCSNRKPWYKVPIIKNGDVFFFKRYHLIPRIVVNESNTYTTDMCYNIRLKKEYEKYSLVFCFYNSLTLALCEYYGRFYGGGVCELTPNEFKTIVIPYKKIEKKYVNKLNDMIKECEDANKITEFVDQIVFCDLYDKKLFDLLKSIRKKYLKRRLKQG